MDTTEHLRSLPPRITMPPISRGPPHTLIGRTRHAPRRAHPSRRDGGPGICNALPGHYPFAPLPPTGPYIHCEPDVLSMPSCIKGSLSVSSAMRPPPPLPGSLIDFGWKLDPNYMIRLDPPARALYPFPRLPPGSSSQLSELPSPTAPNNAPSPSEVSPNEGRLLEVLSPTDTIIPGLPSLLVYMSLGEINCTISTPSCTAQMADLGVTFMTLNVQ